jgi:3-dehydroquinate synthase
MNRINIFGTTSYDVVIDKGITDRLGTVLRDEIGGIRAMIVSDSTVASLYLGSVLSSLRDAGYETSSITLSGGEAIKSLENFELIVNALAEKEFSRADLLIALGGGTVGDLAGFVASTFKRGMKLVQVPTTLLAMVDSSIGGKTAINLPSAKNQVGSFYNPSMVVCDPDLLASLPHENLLDGYAEIIKYGILNGMEIIDALRSARDTGDYSKVIALSVNAKKELVEADEKDSMFRQFLNLGHLVGHAIESALDYTISHGHAVAIGLSLEAKACALSGLTSFNCYNSINDILEEFGFDITESYSFELLLPYIHKDKRIADDNIKLIVPVSIGECVMRNMSIPELDSILKLAL